MSKEFYNERKLIKNSNQTGLEPIVNDNPTFYTTNTPDNQIAPNEMFWNNVDKKLWIGYKSGGTIGSELIYPQTPTAPAIATFSNKTKFPNVVNWQSFNLTNGGAATVSTTANLLRGYPVIIWDDVTIDAIQIRTGTGVAGSLLIGIYKFENGEGTDLVYTSPVFNTGISGYISFTGQNLFLEKGAYIIAYNTDVAVSLVSHTALPSLFGEGAPGGAGNQVNVAYTYTGTLPTTFPSSTVSVSTFVPIRVQFQLI